jgi:hypothetical protein
MNYIGRDLIIYNSLVSNFGQRDEKTLERFVNSLRSCDCQVLTNILDSIGLDIKCNPTKKPPALREILTIYEKKVKLSPVKTKCSICNGDGILSAVSDRMGELIHVDEEPFATDDLNVVVLDCSCKRPSAVDDVKKYARGHLYSNEARRFIDKCVRMLRPHESDEKI